MRDIFHNVNPLQAIAPVSVGDNTVQTSAWIDTAKYEGAAFLYNIGAIGAAGATFTITVEEADAANQSDAAQAANGVLQFSSLVFAQAQQNSSLKVGYLGFKRFVRTKITPAANNAAALLSAIVLLGFPHHAPTPDTPA